MTIKNKKIILAVILVIMLVIMLVIILRPVIFSLSKIKHTERFNDITNLNIPTSIPTTTNSFTNPKYERNRTLLYGSLFLDNLDEQIQRLTNPPIQYDTKRIEIVKYSDIVL